jgi:hypothetical protein
MPSVNIPIQDARNIYTQASLGVWREELPATNLFRSFFTQKVMPTKNISIEVKRSTRMIASDIVRGTEGNKNNFGYSTSKLYQPPYFAENFNNTDLMLYDQIWGNYSEAVAPALLQESIEEIKENYSLLKTKIERTYELQCAQIFQTGTVVTKSQDTINFNAKATHMVTLETKWDNATPKIFSSIQIMCDTLKKDGAAAVEFDLILGASALNSFVNSSEYLALHMYPRTINEYIIPKLNTVTGAVFINRIPIGPYIINIWSYNEYYDDLTGKNKTYLDAKKVVLVASSFKGNMAFAAVPRVLTDNGILANQQFSQTLEAGAYVLNNFVKPEVSSHVFEIKSAGLAVPTTIDHFACMTVLS